MANSQPKLILLSSGGTGGHVFPAAALGHDLVSRGYRVEWITDTRGEKYRAIFGEIPVHVVKSGTLGGGILGKVRGITSLGLGIMQAGRLLDRLRPAAVVGFGGYPSVPALYAAQRKGIPTVIHEQNAILGRANVLLARRADRIALSMAHVSGLDEADAMKAIVTGNPVRAEIANLFSRSYPAIEQDGPLRLFVMGGSQGARVFSEVLPVAVSRLSPAHRARLDIVQQCRAEDIEKARQLYAGSGVKVRLETFYDDVPEILARTHLVISRSGASTVAEVTAAGRPAIFVPYPHHRDQQQKINAESVADVGGAWVMTESGFTEAALLARLETFLQNPESLFRAAEASRSCGKPDAARRLGNLVVALSSGWQNPAGQSFDHLSGQD
jgi:UDP-N-acetylglucosamine--N-acetylmuramyl-(pentapeptide) pyrophosphoryl-undecaprenol N-acetylglucosamine transferase